MSKLKDPTQKATITTTTVEPVVTVTPMPELVPTAQENAQIIVLIAAVMAAYGYNLAEISITSVKVAALVPIDQEQALLFVLIAAAVAAYGYSPAQISVIRPVGGKAWAQAARYDVVHTRNQMF
jgi:Flp pilus assembly pilin Flp